MTISSLQACCWAQASGQPALWRCHPRAQLHHTGRPQQHRRPFSSGAHSGSGRRSGDGAVAAPGGGRRWRRRQRPSRAAPASACQSSLSASSRYPLQTCLCRSAPSCRGRLLCCCCMLVCDAKRCLDDAHVPRRCCLPACPCSVVCRSLRLATECSSPRSWLEPRGEQPRQPAAWHAAAGGKPAARPALLPDSPLPGPALTPHLHPPNAALTRGW